MIMRQGHNVFVQSLDFADREAGSPGRNCRRNRFLLISPRSHDLDGSDSPSPCNSPHPATCKPYFANAWGATTGKTVRQLFRQARIFVTQLHPNFLGATAITY